jgi:hypothetical protein
MSTESPSVGDEHVAPRLHPASEAPARGAAKAQPRRRGRPPGSESLTTERYETILSYIRGGAFDYVAAEMAGISARTFRDWIARGEDTHPNLHPEAPPVRSGRPQGAGPGPGWGGGMGYRKPDPEV